MKCRATPIPTHESIITTSVAMSRHPAWKLGLLPGPLDGAEKYYIVMRNNHEDPS